ncbi:hypothetical protein SAMN05192529_11112 [Arachidicoccus rhizosphaerae]|jgi:hypothetical protein|uniref:Uncharacterized protein n=1 Tax=Arachidicoccus rhizosphaerae TaxID=551991 RepID=A0A1H3ZHD3_9BACT|nr:hypothetical protein [Arachidicoccus rhizosphaerae]SEA22684.1 hypothetical protein SAMN05192529_11112 [Arachidicoccus rhizosphaerae]
MKIRILDNSIRIRLTKSEVICLYEQGSISSSTAFASGTLLYRVDRYEGRSLKVDFRDAQLTIQVPAAMTLALYNTDQVGFEDKTGTVSILIEKDFVCLDNKTEDQSDHYPNPNKTC